MEAAVAGTIRRLVKGLAALGTAVGVVAGAAPEPALAADPPKAVINWSVAPRYRDANGDGRPDAAKTASEAQPSSFDVTLDGCASTGVDTDRGFRWTLPGGASVFTMNCRYTWRATAQGTHTVSLSVANEDGVGTTVSRQVRVKDLLIVSIGDSLGSGEGNPDVLKTSSADAVWEDKRCHRSTNAASARAARAIEDSDPTTSVTFVHVACSGAKIDVGLLQGYDGIEAPWGSEKLPPQLDALKSIIGGRSIDGLMISIGINDLNFLEIAKSCVWHDDCRSKEAELFTTPIERLPGLYEELANRLATLFPNLSRDRVFINEYPDNTRRGNSNLSLPSDYCDKMLENTWFWGEMKYVEAKWASETVVTGLNRTVANAAQAHGWTYVDHVADQYRFNGYCAPAGQRMFVRYEESKERQGNETGTLHPNSAGHDALKNRFLAFIEPALLPASVDGDARTDIFVTGGAGWDTLPTALSVGAGSFSIRNASVGQFGALAATSNVTAVRGDFNGDRRTDVALVGGSGWTTLPVAMSNGDGSFTFHNPAVGWFGASAATANVKPLAGDFNGDGRTDIGLVGGAGWTTLPVATSLGNGSFSLTNNSVGDFAVWSRTANVKVLTGDFNGDRRTDVALTGGAGWNTLPVATSTGAGTFSISNNFIGDFAGWAQGSTVKASAGDFDGDGRTDLALTSGTGWASVPLATSTGSGFFTVKNLHVGDFAAWAQGSTVKVLTGDFNGDRRTDLALTGGTGWNTLPVAILTDAGSFSVTNSYVGDFGAWAQTANVKVLTGDFNGDRHTDVALTGASGWTTLPVATSTGGGGFSVTNAQVGGFATWTNASTAKVLAG